MMRIRTIKPEFWTSHDIARLDHFTRLLFIGLWSYVDDNGVGRDEEQLILCTLFPLDPLTEGSVSTHGGLKQLAEVGLITRYLGPDGRPYLEVTGWEKHQVINRKSKPRFPQYDAENCTLTEGSVSTHGGFTEDSLPEQGTGNREQGTGNTPHNPPQAGGACDDTNPPAFELVEPPADTDPDFDAFWAAYPRRTGKEAARKAWRKAIRRAKPAEIIAGAARYRDDPNRDEAYTKHPGPWLNDGRWTDDPLPPRTGARAAGGSTDDRVRGWLNLAASPTPTDPRKEIRA